MKKVLTVALLLLCLQSKAQDSIYHWVLPPAGFSYHISDTFGYYLSDTFSFFKPKRDTVSCAYVIGIYRSGELKIFNCKSVVIARNSPVALIGAEEDDTRNLLYIFGYHDYNEFHFNDDAAISRCHVAGRKRVNWPTAAEKSRNCYCK